MSTLHSQRGSALLLTLFFTSLFIVLFGAILSYIMAQHRAVQYEVRKAQAINVAEAGVQYFRWQLAHDEDDYASHTDTQQYTDPQGGVFGEYDIEVTPPEDGSTVTTIMAKGNHISSPKSTARVQVRYAEPSLTEFAFLTNSNVWFGDREVISGEIHSNGGVRMDGEGDSLLTSAQETYTCGLEHGCADETKPGVWGDGIDPQFWKYPEGYTDFNAFLVDLEQIKTAAEDDGLYLANSGTFGYFIEFEKAGTLTVHKVTAVHNAVTGYNGTEWVTEAIDKKTWSAITAYKNIPFPDNGLIFVDDNVWVSGEVKGRATIVAARLPSGSYTPADIYLDNTLAYASKDGTDALGLIAQQDVLITLRSANVLRIDAAMLAINGHVFRYYYPKGTKDPYKSFAEREKIETYGTIVTNLPWSWSWVESATGPVVSGYRTSAITYDPNMYYAPPPFFPHSTETQFISWEELQNTEQ